MPGFIKCFVEAIKIPDFKSLLEKHGVTEDMPEDQQREIGNKVAKEYYEKLNKDLNGLKKDLKIPQQKYIPITGSDKTKEITEKYNKLIEEKKKDLVSEQIKDTPKVETPPPKPPEPPKEEEKPEESISKEIGTKKRLNDALREEMDLKPLELQKGLTKDEGVIKGKELVDNGEENPIEIISHVLDNKDNPNALKISPNNEFAMIYYTRQLDAQRTELTGLKQELEDKVKAEPDNEDAKGDLATVTQKLLNNYDAEERRLNASQIMGNVGSKYFNARQIAVDERGQVVNSINRIKTIYGNDIPEHIKKQLSDLQQKYDDLTVRNQKIEQEHMDAKAANELLKQQLAAKDKKRGLFGTKKAKKTDAEFETERKSIIDKMRADLLKVAKGGSGTFATIPLAPQLKAVVPHVAALVRNLAEQGLNKLDDVVLKIHEDVKDLIDGITKEDIRDIISGKYNDTTTRTELEKKVSDLRTQAKTQIRIEELENGIVAATKKKGEQSPEVRVLQKRLAETKKLAKNEFADLSTEEIKKQIEITKNKIAKGEFVKTPIVKRTFETNENWKKNNQELANVKKQLRELEYEASQGQKSMYMRGLDWTNRWGRRVIFFGANAVYTKLSSAALLGSFAHRPFEQALGKVNKFLYPHIAKNAPIEGFINMAAEIKFYEEFLNPKKFIKNTYDIARHGETELSKELGVHPSKHHIPIVDLFAADAHIMIKDPVKRATFQAALMNNLKYYAENGMDGTHPLLLESARQAAYKTAEYEIFQNSAKKASGVKMFFNELQKSGILNNAQPDAWSKIKGNAQYTVASLYHFFVPVNTVPLNIMKRIGLGLRTPLTMAESMAKNKAIKDGILNMTEDEANLLMVQLKKGQIGTAYWTLGFILGGTMLGGAFTRFDPDKKRRDGLKSDVMKNPLPVGGEDVSKNIQHNYQLQSAQMGATWNIVYNHYINDKGATQMQAMAYASAATGGAIAEGIPTLKEAGKVVEAMRTPGGGEQFVKDLKRRIGFGKATSLAELMGYGDATSQNSGGGGASGQFMTNNGVKVELTVDQKKELNDLQEKTTKDYYDRLIGTSEYKSADRATQIKMESKFDRDATEYANNKIKEKYPDQFPKKTHSEIEKETMRNEKLNKKVKNKK